MGNVFNQCPRCSVDLVWGATSCDCGWKKRARSDRASRPPPDPVACAHDGCSSNATLRLRTATGWANLCRGHAERHWGRVAEDFCVFILGLKTLEEKKEYCLRGMAEVGQCTPERWMDSIDQRTVDIILRAGLDQRALERMRAAGVLDRDNQVIPKEERAGRAPVTNPGRLLA
jgi:hypothetical protein